jgi:hypothetical protein
MRDAKSLLRLLAPGLFATAFAQLLGPLPGAPFDFSALILVLALGAAWWAMRASPDAGRPR